MKQRTKSKELAVIGLGYVGWPLALLGSKRGFHVVGIDIDGAKIEQLQDEAQEHNIHVDTSFEAMGKADVVVVCVPTPVHESHEPDLEPLIGASESLAPYVRKGQLIVIESTVNPGVCEEVVLPILLKGSGLQAGDFYFAHCPERINPGDPEWNVSNIPRVIGGLDAPSLRKAASFYESILSAPIKPLASLKEAEAVKMVENSFRDINIAFVNELAMSFSKLGIDVVNVIEGASTKPFSFMAHFPGCGVGGHCIPVDPYYLINYAKQNGFKHRFLAMARSVNNTMPSFTVSRLLEALDEHSIKPKSASVAVLGIAYKPNIDDYRESPALVMTNLLKNEGLDVRTYDPYVPALSSSSTLRSALEGAHAVVLATAHDEFLKLRPETLKRQGISIVIDGRNCLPKDRFVKAGMTYRGIGR